MEFLRTRPRRLGVLENGGPIPLTYRRKAFSDGYGSGE